MTDLWYWLFLDHPRTTQNPQTYWSHFRIAFRGSLGLVMAGFWTSTRILKAAKQLALSGRHGVEIRREFGE